MRPKFLSFNAALAVLAMALLPVSAVFAVPVISITGPATAVVGSPISLNVVGSGFTDLYGYQFDVTFNPTLFRATGASEGSFLQTAGTTFFDGGTIDNVAGVESFVFDTLLGPGAGASGSGVLATLTFDTLGAFGNVGTFALANVLALDSSLNEIGVGLAAVRVAAVPEPATTGMIFAGLGVMAIVGGRRRKLAPMRSPVTVA